MAVALLTAGLAAVHLAGSGGATATSGGCDPATGAVLAWGNNASGQLGDGSTADNGVPQAVRALGGSVRSADGGLDHTVAVKADGTVLAWGGNFHGQVGDGSDAISRATPVTVSGLGPGSGVVAVAAGGTHSLALRSDGTVLAWGDNRRGQLGTGGPSPGSRAPVQVSGLGPGSGVVAIAAGTTHSVAVTATGGVLAWGANTVGQLGDGTRIDRAAPVPVRLGEGVRVTSADAGATFTAAVTADGGVLTWGGNTNGELGNGGADTVTRSPSLEQLPPTTLQVAPVGTTFPDRLSFDVRTSDPFPLAGAAVTFRAPTAGASGTFEGGGVTATVLSGPDGRATAPPFTANGISGEYHVLAWAAGSQIAATFVLVNHAGGPHTVTPWGGTPQFVDLGSAAGVRPLQARVTDAQGRPAARVPVTFRAPATGPRAAFPVHGPGGVIDPDTPHAVAKTYLTDARGIAVSETLTTRDESGLAYEEGPFEILAEVANAVAPARFAVTNVREVPGRLAFPAGHEQTARVGEAFPNPVVATAYVGDDAREGVTVTFTASDAGAGGSFPGGAASASAVTDASGLATAPPLTASGTPGVHQVVATAPGANAARLELTNTEAPATLAVVSGDGQWARAGRRFPSLLAVLAADAGGRPVPGVAVTFTAPESGPSATLGIGRGATVVTNALGIASPPRLTAGLEAGPFEIVAAAPGGAAAVRFALATAPVAAPATGLGPGAGVVAVAAGDRHALALKADGSVVAWGGNDRGQLALPDHVASSVPVPVTGLHPGARVAAVAAGARFSLVLHSDGAVWAWGANENGQLGDAATADRDRPVEVAGLGPGSGVVGLAPGVAHVLALRSEASVTPTGGTPQRAFAGAPFVAPLRAAVRAPGGAPVVGARVTFRAPDGAATGRFPGGAGTAVAVTDGSGVATAPTLTAGTVLGGYEVVANAPGVCAGAVFALANTAGSQAAGPCASPAGPAASWGGNLQGQLGDGTTTDRQVPVALAALGTVRAVAAGSAHTLALRPDGSVVAWGDNTFGQLGDGTAERRAAPVGVVGLGPGSDVVDVAAGAGFSVALHGDGTVVAWGWNANGALGNDSTADSRVPVRVVGLGPGSGVVDVAAGARHVLALRSDGSVLAWGWNQSGQLGDGTAVSRARPGPVAVPAEVTDVSAGAGHSLARLADGSVMAWGDDGAGQLGDGAGEGSRATPAAVTGMGPGSAVAVAAGGSHNVALRADGSVVAWGSNQRGQLGDGTTVARPVPGPVDGLGPGSGVVAVSAGSSTAGHSAARKADGSVVSWGSNEQGQLGDGTTTNAARPVGVHGLGPAGAAVVEAGDVHTVALLAQPVTTCAGTPQRVQVGGEFGSRLRAMVRDDGGRPVPGVDVTFTAPPTGASGSFGAGGTTAVVATDAAGVATAPALRANGVAGRFDVVARTAASGPSAAFTLTNLPGAPAAVAVAGGTGQQTRVRTVFPGLLRALVADAGGNPLPGVTVTFTAPAAGATGTFAGAAFATAVTDGAGIAGAPLLRANGVAGSYTVTARVAGVAAAATFGLSNVPGPPARMVTVAGDGQTAPARSTLPVRLEVAVTDAEGNPVPGAGVTFSAPRDGPTASFPGPAATAVVATGGDGRALAPPLTAGATPGTYTVVASIGGRSPFVVFSLVTADGPRPPVSVLAGSATRPSGGYRLVAADGGVFAFGAPFLGSTGALRLAAPIVGSASTPTGAGYWLVAADGGVFAFGDARFAGSTGGMRLAAPIVAMAATPTGAGYWLVAADGGVFAFGDARFLGSTGGMKLAAPIVAMAATPTSAGYWLVAADGGVFAFGDARFLGSTGGMKLTAPIVAASPNPTGAGYLLVAADGGVFAFGEARFHGSTGAVKLARPIVAVAATPTGGGYLLVAADGGVFAFGDARFLGSTGASRLAAPIVAVTP